jgi:predicted RNA methylase
MSLRRIVPISRVQKAGQSALYVVRTQGPSALVRRVWRQIVGGPPRQDAFDVQYGVDTSGEISLYQLNISSPNASAGTRYQASPAGACRSALKLLPINPREFVFVDLGAGKGRVLLVASEFAFTRVIGVEFAEELVEVARQNLTRLGCRAEVVHSDATQYHFPAHNLVVYLYNPFRPEILRHVLESLHNLARTHEVYLVYLNPEYADCVSHYASEIRSIDNAKLYRFHTAVCLSRH